MSSQFQGGQIPDMGSLNDPLGFVKKLWGDMQIPGMVTPTISVDELDKKIKDLKTVESWLSVNMNMLRGTIQAMEVQRATIATLKSMSESFSQQMGNPAPTSASATAAAEAKAKAEWPMPPAESAEKSAAEKSDEAATKSASKPKAQAKATTEAPSAASNEFANPAAWWGLLQEQFKQAVSQVMETEPAVKKSASAAKPNGAESKTAKKASAKASPAAKKPVAKKSAAKTSSAPAKASSKRASP